MQPASKAVAACIAFVLVQTAVLCVSQSLGQSTGSQLTSSILTEPRQRALFDTATTPFLLDFNNVPAASVTDNAAVVQRQADKSAFPLLSTLNLPGSAVFLTAMKPCSILLPHLHPRATEIYTILNGTMTCGLAEENNFRQNLAFNAVAGQAFVAPQGLLHFNHNQQCFPLVFTQFFNNADPGSINVIGALAAMQGTAAASIQASNVTAAASPQRAFALDQACLSRCGFPSTGAPYPPANAPAYFPVSSSAAPATSG